MAKKISDDEKAMVAGVLKVRMKKRTEGEWAGHWRYMEGPDGKLWTDKKVGAALEISSDKVRRVRNELYDVSHHKAKPVQTETRLDPVDQAIDNAVQVEQHETEQAAPRDKLWENIADLWAAMTHARDNTRAMLGSHHDSLENLHARLIIERERSDKIVAALKALAAATNAPWPGPGTPPWKDL